MKKKVLIIGNSAKEYALAKKMAETCEVSVLPGNDGMKEFAECVDIRETATDEILEFIMENGIDMVIPVSAASVNTNITALCAKNNIQAFAPAQEAAALLLDKFSAKKMMYKLGIPTPKFGIFEKQSAAADYIKNIKIPYVLKDSRPASAVVLTSQKLSKPILDSAFTESNSKVLVEDYIFGTPFGFYAITDGYNALPIGSSILYKHSLEGGGGQLTSGMGACSPNYKLSFKNEEYLMNNVIYPTLDYLERNSSTYMGIIGVNGILCEDSTVKILGYQSFMQDSDCAGIIELLDINLYKLFESCIVGSFSDEISYIKQKDMVSVSVVLSSRNTDNSENIIQNIDTPDDNIIISYTNNVFKNKYLEYEVKGGQVLVLTALAATHNSASAKVYNEIDNINFKGMKYRRDICKIADFTPVL